MTNEDIRVALEKAAAAVANAQKCAEASEWLAVNNFTLSARMYLHAVANEAADRTHRARMRKGR